MTYKIHASLDFAANDHLVKVHGQPPCVSAEELTEDQIEKYAEPAMRTAIAFVEGAFYACARISQAIEKDPNFKNETTAIPALAAILEIMGEHARIKNEIEIDETQNFH